MFTEVRLAGNVFLEYRVPKVRMPPVESVSGVL